MNAHPPRADQLIRLLGLLPHPEGGHYREVFRSPHAVQPADDRAARSALPTIDFLLVRGQFSAWHRVRSDEVWHLMEGDGLRLWLLSPDLDRLQAVDLGALRAGGQLPAGDQRAMQPGGMEVGQAPRHVVPAGWWQAAEPLGDYALCGATVGPGFDFADFSFLRDEPLGRTALLQLDGSLTRLLP